MRSIWLRVHHSNRTHTHNIDCIMRIGQTSPGSGSCAARCYAITEHLRPRAYIYWNILCSRESSPHATRRLSTIPDHSQHNPAMYGQRDNGGARCAHTSWTINQRQRRRLRNVLRACTVRRAAHAYISRSTVTHIRHAHSRSRMCAHTP